MGGTLTSSTVLLETLCSHLWKLYDKKQPWVFESWTFDAVFEQVCHKPLEDWLAETPETCQTERLSEAYAHSFYPWLKARPGFILIHGFPAPMAMLAKPQHSDRPRQRHGRWELHYQSIELLNGYEEIETLSDLTQHVNRYPDLLNHARIHGSQLLDPRTSKILEAHPLPPCAGNALGINRLLMILLGQDQIHKPPCYDSPCYTSGV
jgi:elongation factor P--beta-lysine ligase